MGHVVGHVLKKCQQLAHYPSIKLALHFEVMFSSECYMLAFALFLTRRKPSLENSLTLKQNKSAVPSLS